MSPIERAAALNPTLDGGLRTSKAHRAKAPLFGVLRVCNTFPRTTITCGQARGGSAGGVVRRVLLDIAVRLDRARAVLPFRWEKLPRGAELTGLKIFRHNTLQTVSATMNGEVLTAPS